ncbi:MAG: hypothetical protein K6E98_13130 [Lachnospiraceae bacterium]|nr:hypothetical protein [Lachnospiraceae bacterium]
MIQLICYNTIYSDIINIVDGYDMYGEKTSKDRCNDIAIYISDWKSQVEGEFWNDSPYSSMHSGERGEFIADAKKEIQDMVQVYFQLMDEQALDMWSMEETQIGNMLRENKKLSCFGRLCGSAVKI